MKILELRFKNLNSLYGEWFIDFSDPEYIENGIFALTGPTGSGKSTILDAICLALYGSTPRLGKITKSGNQIMSRQMGECYSEVIFQSQAGTFRSHWRQHRARKKADGNLLDAHHEISEAPSGKILEDKRSKVPSVIEEKTGMDFDRFTRSMLLAQGGFDTFLKAHVEDKSRILEQITGTEIYTKISLKVHDRLGVEREKLKLLQAEISGIVLLEPQEISEIQQLLEAKQIEEKQQQNKLDQSTLQLNWLKEIALLKQELNLISDESIQLETDFQQFETQRNRLSIALKAAQLDGIFGQLKEVRKNQQQDQKELNLHLEQFPSREEKVRQSKVELDQTEKNLEKLKKEKSDKLPLLQKVRLLDQQLEDQKKLLQQNQSECSKDESKIKKEDELASNKTRHLQTLRKELQITKVYLQQNSKDEWLVGGLTGLEQRLNQLVLKNDQVSEINKTIKKNQKSHISVEKKWQQADKKLNSSKNQLIENQQALELKTNELQTKLDGKLLREYQTEKDNLLREMSLLRTIRDLEEERTRLADGKPCPLCGSLEHPFAQGNIPEMDVVEQKISGLSTFIKEVENSETEIKQLESKGHEINNSLNKMETACLQTKLEKESLQKAFEENRNELEIAQISLKVLKEDLKELVSDYKMDLDQLAPDAAIKQLRERLNQWQEHKLKEFDQEKKITEIQSEIQQNQAVLEQLKLTLQEKQKNAENMKNEFQQNLEQRKQLFGSQKPDQVELELDNHIKLAENTARKKREIHEEANLSLNSTKNTIQVLKERIENRTLQLQQQEQEFEQERKTNGFDSEVQFIGAMLQKTERDKLEQQAKKLDDRKIDLLARKNDRDERLNNLLASPLTDNSIEETQNIHETNQLSLKEIRNELSGISHKLSENKKAQERIKDKQATIDTQKTECERWAKLHALIGSSDGKKFRNFAQGLTFELMVSHANQQLVKMTDRYLLVRDKEQPLDLNVMDNYQAGEIRTTKNLSGGESFIVSLTLALGLSKMASQKVRVDSLFLDEGFGTLDEDALESALETLSSLHQEGKLIGVISHIPALKERISTQINVMANPDGRSSINGPGCQNVS